MMLALKPVVESESVQVIITITVAAANVHVFAMVKRIKIIIKVAKRVIHGE